MANRPLYIPNVTGTSFVTTQLVEFQWFPGFSKQQKQRSIAALHKAAKDILHLDDILEISSKSPLEIGTKLSAFHLTIPRLKDNGTQTISVESAFQSSKAFKEGGPYYDLLEKTSLESKRDERLKNSGSLQKFIFQAQEWELEPKTAFYDWLYLTALGNNPNLAQNLLNYQAFTDIEFNPKKSINCQAYSAALFVCLTKRKLLKEAMSSPKHFLCITKSLNSTGIYNGSKHN